MSALRTHWAAISLVAASFLVALLLLGRMPATVPIHWDAHGTADGFGPRGLGALLTPTIGAAVVVLLLAVERLAPDAIGRFSRVWRIFVLVLAAFFLAVTAVTTIAATGTPLDVARWIGVATGGLFAVLGNYFGKLPRNRWAGIRTPWSLASDEVWHRTHRLGGKLFVAAGLVGIVAAFTSEVGILVLVGATALATLVAVVASYVFHRELATRA